VEDQNSKMLEETARILARALLRTARLGFPGMNAEMMARAILIEEAQDLSPIEENSGEE
jgi:hypothetical protein